MEAAIEGIVWRGFRSRRAARLPRDGRPCRPNVARSSRRRRRPVRGCQPARAHPRGARRLAHRARLADARRLPVTPHGIPRVAMTSATASTIRWVFARGTEGNTDASTTRNRIDAAAPCSAGSTTASSPDAHPGRSRRCAARRSRPARPTRRARSSVASIAGIGSPNRSIGAGVVISHRSRCGELDDAAARRRPSAPDPARR